MEFEPVDIRITLAVVAGGLGLVAAWMGEWLLVAVAALAAGNAVRQVVRERREKSKRHGPDVEDAGADAPH
ncbi:hypothetical protein [Demequina sp. NBRC 110057]|uniref:hypothetical protein n=1 Tax=Demequina sp. NBRC 110057 TaxID=1570346 RepID=UPI0009FBB6BB|nr:hypothetical protein [Demequina sp. NBRC 110057]